ncbi:MAG: vWA domain-containing protein, partial [Pirellulales bacterium]
VPGVTITNNLIVRGGQGGILFSGTPDPGGSPVAPVPFGRIINNTIVGLSDSPPINVDVVFLVDTSTGMDPEIAQLKRVITDFDQALNSASINPSYALVEFPRTDTSDDPLLVQDVVDFATFTVPGGPFDQLAAGAGDIENGSLAVREALNDVFDETTINFRNGSSPALILITDEDDNSDVADFNQADALLGTNGASFSFIGTPGVGNTDARYGFLANVSGGSGFDVADFLANPEPFFASFVNGIIAGFSSNGNGIEVANNASPTILNNILANLAVGITVDATSQSTVIGGSLFKRNTRNTNRTVGDFAIELADIDPLFVDASGDNFLLQAGSPAIDSSVDALEDRPELITVRDPLGISLSPILAPDRDATGQLRVDDPAVETPPGQGANVFKDRGALDRSDFVAPTARLLNPRDNDAEGNDRDPTESVVELSGQVVREFSIQLLDGFGADGARGGTGVDDVTVTSASVSVSRDGVPLEIGLDYTFSYDPTNKTIRLTPLAGIWEPESTYQLRFLANNTFLIVAPSTGAVADGDTFTIRDEMGSVATFEYETGYTLQVPETGAGPGGIADGERFSITGQSQTVTFEFDSNGSSTVGNRAISFTPASTSDEIADAVAAAILDADLGPTPTNLGDGFVHIGGAPDLIFDLPPGSPLVLSGQPGLRAPNAVAIEITPAFSSDVSQ